jgi:hypothetical protein
VYAGCATGPCGQGTYPSRVHDEYIKFDLLINLRSNVILGDK